MVLIRTYNSLPQAVIDIRDISTFQRALQIMAINALESHRSFNDICSLQCFEAQYLDFEALYAR